MRGLIAYADDRMNPVLVKEVRQSLRGKQFKISFWFTVSAATLIGIFVMLAHALDGDYDQLGARFLLSIFACMAVALMVFVPIMAFFSMGAEWEENTYDLLVLSDMRPRRIIAGKLHSAGIQALLFLSAFGPFLVFSFLLRGVDLIGLLASIALCVAGSFAFSSLAICLSSLTSVRFARVVLLVVLTAGAVQTTTMLIFAAGAMQFEGMLDLTQPEQQAGLVGVFMGIAVFGALAYAVACARLSHAEENRSTGLRALATAGLIAGIVWMAWFFDQSGGDTEVLSGFSCALLFYAAITAAFAATEPETLGRRTALHVPRSRALALLAVPFLPGGGRGALLFALHLALIAAGVWISLLGAAVVGRPLEQEGGWAVVVLTLYLCVYVLLPAGALAGYTGTFLGRLLVRVAILLFFLIATFIPAILGFFLGDPTLMEMKHPGHPFWVMDGVWNGDVQLLSVGSIVAVGLLALLAVAANLPRALRGVAEVVVASSARSAAARDPDDSDDTGAAQAGTGGADALAGS